MCIVCFCKFIVERRRRRFVFASRLICVFYVVVCYFVVCVFGLLGVFIKCVCCCVCVMSMVKYFGIVVVVVNCVVFEC